MEFTTIQRGARLLIYLNRFVRKTAALGFVPRWFMWNVFESGSVRTNNHVEGWHSRLKKVVWKAHSNIFEIVRRSQPRLRCPWHSFLLELHLHVAAEECSEGTEWLLNFSKGLLLTLSL